MVAKVPLLGWAIVGALLVCAVAIVALMVYESDIRPWWRRRR